MTFPLRGNLKQGWHISQTGLTMLCGVQLDPDARILTTTTRIIHQRSVCETCLRIARADRQLRSKV